MTSTQSREFENSIRRETAFRLAEILKNRSTIRQILPVYEIQISAACCKRFLFVPLDTSKKGKKRVYTTRGATPNSSDLFISYMSEKDARRLERRSEQTTIGLESTNTRANIFSNRWVLTKGKPVKDIKDFCELWSRFRAVERVSSKANRPPEGSNTSVYAVNYCYLPDYSGTTPKIVCRLKRLHKGVSSHDRRSSLGVH